MNLVDLEGGHLATFAPAETKVFFLKALKTPHQVVACREKKETVPFSFSCMHDNRRMNNKDLKRCWVLNTYKIKFHCKKCSKNYAMITS